MAIPFVPFPPKAAVKMSRSFFPLSARLVKMFPDLDVQLRQSNMEMNAKDYLSIALFAFSFWFFLMFVATFPLFVKMSLMMGLFSLGLSFIVSLVVFMNILYYPKLIVARRVNNMERNLVFSLRYIVIQIKSGVPLFDAFESVAGAGYGALSAEFGRLVKEVSSGIALTDAIENLIYRNPSIILRRVLWQMVNSIKSGVDVGNSLSLMLQNISQEQMVEIRKYGSQLNPMALMYMMFAVIIPTLGLTLLMVFSLFSGFTFQQSMFYLILVVLTVFQFSFIGIIKSRRPRVEL